jgi:GT2 family glycosyltransferase
VLPGTLGPLVDYLRSHPDLGAVTTRMYDPDGGLQRNCSRFPAFRLLLLDYTFLGRLLGGQRRRLRQWAWYEGWDRTTERDVDVAPGSFLLARRAALGAVGGFDERFRLYFTEDDWCRRLRDAGYGVRYVPLGGVVHPEGTSVKTVPKMAHRIYFDDLDRFTAKYYGRPRATVLSILALPTRWRRSTAGGQGA